VPDIPFLDAALLSLLAAIGFGLAIVTTQFGLRHISPGAGAVVSVWTCLILFWLTAPFGLDTTGWSGQALAIFAVVGLFFPGLVTILNFEANLRLGPTLAGTISGTAPLFAIGGAALMLAEVLTLRGIAGTLAIVLGVAALTWRDKDAVRRWSSRALLIPLAAAAGRGLAQTVLKAGLVLWPNPFAALLIGYTMSTATVTAGGHLRAGKAGLALRRSGVLWFMFVGLLNGGATLAMYAALSRGPVALVSPIAASFPLFTLLFSALLLRQERLTRRIAAGVILTVAGVILLLLR
jgi:drug/metabolite transporter (DMT)-like permease